MKIDDQTGLRSSDLDHIRSVDIQCLIDRNGMDQLARHLICHSDEGCNVRNMQVGVSSEVLSFLIGGSSIDIEHVDNGPKLSLALEFKNPVFDDASKRIIECEYRFCQAAECVPVQDQWQATVQNLLGCKPLNENFRCAIHGLPQEECPNMAVLVRSIRAMELNMV